MFSKHFSGFLSRKWFSSRTFCCIKKRFFKNPLHPTHPTFIIFECVGISGDQKFSSRRSWLTVKIHDCNVKHCLLIQTVKIHRDEYLKTMVHTWTKQVATCLLSEPPRSWIIQTYATWELISLDLVTCFSDYNLSTTYLVATRSSLVLIEKLLRPAYDSFAIDKLHTPVHSFGVFPFRIKRIGSLNCLAKKFSKSLRELLHISLQSGLQKIQAF